MMRFCISVLAKGVALKHGMEATFMAKPFIDRAGSGLHMHVSVNDKAGKNIFASDAPEGTPALEHAIGGMKALLADSMAIFAPNANSYRRFKRQFLRAGGADLGRQQPHGGVPRTGRRAADAACRAPRRGRRRASASGFGRAFGGVHHGMTKKLDPGPAVVGRRLRGGGQAWREGRRRIGSPPPMPWRPPRC